jgi:hypothetical protein
VGLRDRKGGPGMVESGGAIDDEQARGRVELVSSLSAKEYSTCLRCYVRGWTAADTSLTGRKAEQILI